MCLARLSRRHLTETHDDNQYGECSNYAEQCQSDQCSRRVQCQLDFQICLEYPSDCTYLYAAPSL